MSFRYAVVDSTTNKVVNVVLWDGEVEWTPPDNTIAIKSDEAGIDDTWDGVNFIKPYVEIVTEPVNGDNVVSEEQ